MKSLTEILKITLADIESETGEQYYDLIPMIVEAVGEFAEQFNSADEIKRQIEREIELDAERNFRENYQEIGAK